VIEFLTKLWGGSRCVVIRTDGKTIDEEFWAILSSHHPDVLYRVSTDRRRSERACTHVFERLVSEQVREWASQNDLRED
jgi:hypothetical protein